MKGKQTSVDEFFYFLRLTPSFVRSVYQVTTVEDSRWRIYSSNLLLKSIVENELSDKRGLLSRSWFHVLLNLASLDSRAYGWPVGLQIFFSPRAGPVCHRQAADLDLDFWATVAQLLS